MSPSDSRFPAPPDTPDVPHPDVAMIRAPSSGPETFTGGKKILLVDDSSATLTVLEGMLEGIGDLRSATTSADALRIAESWHPDLVVCDIHIDEMSGVDICRRMKSRGSTEDIDFILISSSRDLDSEIAALTAGAADFIEKPLKAARVRSRVLNQLRAHARIASITQRAARSFSNDLLGFISCSLEGTVLEIAPPIGRLLAPGWLDGAPRPLWDLVDDDARGELQRRIAAARQLGRLDSMRARLLRADRARLDARLYGWVSSSAQGRVLLIAVEDDRERLRAERTRISRSVEAVLVELCGGIAHQLNNRLQITLGHLEEAGESALSTAAQRHLDQAREGLEQSAQMASRLGEYALSRGRYRARALPLDETLGSMRTALAARAPGALELDLQGPALQVSVDPAILEHVLGELIAGLAADGGPPIVLSSRDAVSRSTGDRLARLELHRQTPMPTPGTACTQPGPGARAESSGEHPSLPDPGLVFLRQDVELMSGSLRWHPGDARGRITLDLPAEPRSTDDTRSDPASPPA